MIASQPFDGKTAWTDGYNKFLQTYFYDLRTDFPKIDDFLPQLTMIFFEKGLLSLKDLVFLEPGAADSENAPMVEAYYHLMAILLKLHYDKTKNWSDITTVFKPI